VFGTILEPVRYRLLHRYTAFMFAGNERSNATEPMKMVVLNFLIPILISSLITANVQTLYAARACNSVEAVS